jgi:hypothetical protein
MSSNEGLLVSRQPYKSFCLGRSDQPEDVHMNWIPKGGLTPATSNWHVAEVHKHRRTIRQLPILILEPVQVIAILYGQHLALENPATTDVGLEGCTSHRCQGSTLGTIPIVIHRHFEKTANLQPFKVPRISFAACLSPWRQTLT